jgi:3-polyprenyl-4-hydroxybenzoate decarboxylase
MRFRAAVAGGRDDELREELLSTMPAHVTSVEAMSSYRLKGVGEEGVMLKWLMGRRIAAFERQWVADGQRTQISTAAAAT